jgi:hypothetical protein
MHLRRIWEQQHDTDVCCKHFKICCVLFFSNSGNPSMYNNITEKPGFYHKNMIPYNVVQLSKDEDAGFQIPTCTYSDCIVPI